MKAINKIEEKDLNEKINAIREAQRLEDENYEDEIEAFEKEMDLAKLWKKETPPERFRKATMADYTKWLRGYLKRGGNITHCYDYGMPEDFYVANKDFSMIPLCGAQSIEVIVPKGIKFLGGDIGHCNLYFEDDYRVEGGWVPLYDNVEF